MAVNTTDAVTANKLLLMRSTMIKLLQDYARLMRSALTEEAASLIYLSASSSIPLIHQPLLALDVAFVCLICELSNQPLASQQFLDQVKQCQTHQEVEIIVKTALIMI